MTGKITSMRMRRNSRGASCADRGRPSKLTPEIGGKLAGVIIAGHSISDAFRNRVATHSVQRWRARAYSKRPEDQAYLRWSFTSEFGA
jgi:hypothetical protein